jgi:hypothetical protein
LSKPVSVFKERVMTDRSSMHDRRHMKYRCAPANALADVNQGAAEIERGRMYTNTEVVRCGIALRACTYSLILFANFWPFMLRQFLSHNPMAKTVFDGLLYEAVRLSDGLFINIAKTIQAPNVRSVEESNPSVGAVIPRICATGNAANENLDN